MYRNFIRSDGTAIEYDIRDIMSSSNRITFNCERLVNNAYLGICDDLFASDSMPNLCDGPHQTVGNLQDGY